MKKQIIQLGILLVSCLAFLSFTIITNSIQDPWEVPAKYEKMENPFASDADAENIGRSLYSKHCKSCHGSKGRGDGSKADSVDTEIGDFTEDDFKAQSDGSLYYKSFIGRDDMPSFEKKIKDENQRWLLINYIKKF
jgi:mono/diheme cytochrome c family protein